MSFARTTLKASRAFTSASLRTRSRTLVTLKDHKYTAQAVAQGAGRNGEVTSNGLDLKLALPKEMGGTGQGQNPEQLFAMGYSACLLGAIQAVAKNLGKADMAKNAKVHASVHIGEPEGMPGFGIAVDMKVEGIDEKLLKAGHEFCPYSRLMKNGGVVNVSLA
ncbi:OsmC-like protein [Lentinula lateritia]|uniref:OsmC-like protein n=1 Tax=Lentinula lateritia TaxID=40482 RepID=A0ABQ8V556_9AGAR|nr:OsmC-like protein [Lentinula lateritia]